MTLHAPDKMADGQHQFKDRRMLVLFLLFSLLVIHDLGAYLNARHASPAPEPINTHVLLQQKGQGTSPSADQRLHYFLGRPMDINLATSRDLELITGIGPGLARKILDFRAKHGCIHNMKELQQVPGIGNKMSRRLASQLRFDCP